MERSGLKSDEQSGERKLLKMSGARSGRSLGGYWAKSAAHGHKRRSSVNFGGGKTFCPKIYA